MKDGFDPMPTPKSPECLKYLAFKTLATNEVGNCMILYPCLNIRGQLKLEKFSESFSTSCFGLAHPNPPRPINTYFLLFCFPPESCHRLTTIAAARYDHANLVLFFIFYFFWFYHSPINLMTLFTKILSSICMLICFSREKTKASIRMLLCFQEIPRNQVRNKIIQW